MQSKENIVSTKLEVNICLHIYYIKWQINQTKKIHITNTYS